MKNCSKCGERKPITEFHKSKNRSGETVPASRCKSCAIAAARESYHRRKKESSPDIDLVREQRRRLAEARQKGEKTFLPALPCKYGHMSPKLVSTYQCTKCLRLRKRQQRGGHISASKVNSHRRLTAKNLGKTRFVGSIMCANGHLGDRLVSTGQCCECLRIRERKPSVAAKEKGPDERRNALRRRRWAKVKKRAYQSEVLMGREEYRLKRFMYQSIRRILSQKGGEKDRSARDALGYWSDDLKKRIECGFAPGMSWENYGEWHIDHAIPISHFIAKGEFRPSVINALCNLRPMWAKDNISKGAKHPFKR